MDTRDRTRIRPATKRSVLSSDLRARAVPGPRDRVPGVGVADDDGLHGHPGVESTWLERDQAGSIRASALRKYKYLEK